MILDAVRSTENTSETAGPSAPSDAATGGQFDIQKFFEAFQLLADAPDGVVALRRVVVDFAVRGALVHQALEDGTGSGLLDEIRRVRQVGTRTRFTREEGQDTGVVREAFALPASWTWTTIGEVSQKLGAGSTPLGGRSVYKDSGVKFLRSQNIWNNGLRLADVAFIERRVHEEMSGTHVVPGDILLNITGASIGRTAIVPDEFDEGNVSQHVAIVRLVDKSSRRFVHLAMTAAYFQSLIMEVQVGVSREGLSMRKLQHLPVPLPPLAEQRRIVAKVDQLMALCDEFEARQTKKRETGTRLTKSALEALTTAEDPEAFDAAWTRVVENFDVLIGSSAAVASLRDVILGLAFRGALAEAVPGDQPAAALVGEVQAAWAGKKKRKEVLADVGAGERSPSPARWEWVRLGNLAEVVGGPAKGRDLKSRQVRAYPYLRVANVQRGYLDLGEVKQMEIAEDEIEKYRVLPGDVLFTEGGDWDKLGRSTVWRGEIDECIHQNHIFRARLVTAGLDPLWFSTYANSPLGRRYFEDAAKQTTNLASINMTQLRNCPMPLPPIHEQHRVSAKIHEMMRMCDELEASLRRAEQHASRFVAAAAGELLS